jgi:glycerophosphoryl diester phosphodiesterase
VPAFKKAFEEGFEVIETDPQLTRDGVIVLMHDYSINRTCRNRDGSLIEREIRVGESTYGELLSYDAGIAFGEEFRGTHIPRLEELLELLDGSDTVLDLDKKIPTEELDVLLDTVAKYNVRAEFSCGDVKRIKKVLSRIPHALINYDGQTTEEILAEIRSIVPYDQLIVWMYYDNPHFAWLTDRYKTSPENCARVKKYARLGIANILNTYEMRDAIRWGADVIEPFDLQQH